MKLYHIAIPKTATESLQQSMKDANLDIFITMKYEPNVNYVEAASHKIISGHFHYGLHQLASPRELSKYFTVLRNPLRRAVSDYYFHIEAKTDWVLKMSLTDFINEVPKNIISTQMFGFGVREHDEAFHILNSDYCLVGCMEYLEDFYSKLSVILGAELNIQRLNQSRTPDYFLDLKTIKQFVDKHKLDYLIYEKVLNQRFF